MCPCFCHGKHLPEILDRGKEVGTLIMALYSCTYWPWLRPIEYNYGLLWVCRAVIAQISPTIDRSII